VDVNWESEGGKEWTEKEVVQLGILNSGRGDEGDAVCDTWKKHGEEESTNDRKSGGAIGGLNAAEKIGDMQTFLLHVFKMGVRGECVIQPYPKILVIGSGWNGNRGSGRVRDVERS